MERVADVHLTLPEELVASMDALALQRGVRRAHLVREALAEYIDRAEKERIRQEMQAYVEALAPYSSEFVLETEAHVVQRLLEATEW